MAYPTADLSRRAGAILDEAMRRPVTLTRYKKPRFVILNVEDYERLVSKSPERESYTLDTMPEALRREVLDAFDALAREGDDA